MNDLAEYKRTHNKKKYVQGFPEGILDVIERDYPSQYFLLLEGRTWSANLFSDEQWIDILTKSRSSYDRQIHGMNLSRKYSIRM